MKRRLPILGGLLALTALITASSRVILCASEGLRLCAELIVPSLFPFFVVSSLLARLGHPRFLGSLLEKPARRFLRVSGGGLTGLFIGLTGGYPLGAAYLAELTEQGQLAPRETERLLGFCNNSGPAFLVGAIGAGVFGSARIGLLLYASHILAALSAGLLLRCGGPPASSPVSPPQSSGEEPFPRALAEAVRGAVPAVLSVSGFVILFTVFTGLLEANGFLPVLEDFLSPLLRLAPGQSRALLLGFWELGSGVGALRGLPPSPENLALAAFLVGWGGVSVHFQSLAVFSDLPVNCERHLEGRILSAALGAAFARALAALLL